MTATLSRRSLICNQSVPRVTGIDFVQVVDPLDQTELLVFFVVDPDLVMEQDGPPPVSMIDLSGPVPLAAANSLITIAPHGASGAPVPELDSAEWDQLVFDGSQRTILRLNFVEPGGFYDFELTVNHPLVDPLFNGVVFSFKQGCDSGFDCEPDDSCPPDTLKNVEIDYLARDFTSFNSALHDFAARYYPRWGERLTADAGSMMIDLFAALGDEFAYIQDRFAREAYLETATQRRSLHRLASLVDYRPDPGRNALGWVSLAMRPAGAATKSIELKFAERLPVWAVPGGQKPIAFELGGGLSDTRSIFVHHHWNRMALHPTDPSEPCLKSGATSVYLAPGASNIALPRASQLPAGSTPEDFWIGRWMILASEPSDPAVEARAWRVRITSVSQLTDPLVLTNGVPSRVTRITWSDEHALPHDMRIAETRLYGNIADVSAGRTVTETFRVGYDGSTDPMIRGLPRAVEREGILDQNTCDRSPAIIYGLRATEDAGLSFSGDHTTIKHRVPEIELTEISDLGAPPATSTKWLYQDTLLDADEDDPHFTIDAGMWRDIIRYQRNGTFVVHHDYAGDFGFSIRFGSGEFGQVPETESLFEARFRTFFGERSNLGPGTIRAIDPPDGSPRMPAMAKVADVTNHLSTKDGSEPETHDDIRIRAPEYFRLFPLRAVRDEDYRDIVERDLEEWVEQAGARARWTGSWLTEFVTADPLGATEIAADKFEVLVNLTDQVRQAGRDVIVRQPRFVSVDLKVTICVAPGFYSGQVREAVIEALTGTRQDAGFFSPDRFTFGESLRRSELEAAVQAVPGVAGVISIGIRQRHLAKFKLFDDPDYPNAVLPVAMNEIVRVKNDPAAPENGVVTVYEATSAGANGSAS